MYSTHISFQPFVSVDMIQPAMWMKKTPFLIRSKSFVWSENYYRKPFQLQWNIQRNNQVIGAMG